MNKAMKISNIIICIVLIVIAAISAFAFFNPITESEFENRMLATRPQLNSEIWFSGNFNSEFEEFISDHVLNRMGFIKIAKKIESFIRMRSKIRIVSFD